MEELLAAMRAAAETTRLRLLWLLSQGELNVSELAQILGQSQPRVSRHLKVMCEAGLLDRHKEGSWVLFRVSGSLPGGQWAKALAGLIPADDRELARDAERLNAIRAARARRAAEYFRAAASDWDSLRRLHVSEEQVEAALKRMAGQGPLDLVLDLGTGTGRMLELFAPIAKRAIGIDSSHEMLAIARARLDGQAMGHVQVRHGDVHALPLQAGSADLVVLHQVLHFMDDPAGAIIEAARVLSTAGKLLIADFAPHEREELREDHAHRRLGISAEHMAGYLERAGLAEITREDLPPPAEGGLTVSVWLARHRAGEPHGLKAA